MKCLRFLLCLVLFTMVFHSQSFAQKVPISFSEFHGFEATQSYLKSIEKNYPNYIELREIGRSNMDRPVYVVVLTNRKTGETLDSYIPLHNMRKEGVKNVIPMTPDMGKPGHWISATMHGNEFTGTEVCLYFLDKILTNLESDSDIQELLDRRVFYICPVINPDGLYQSLDLGIPQRKNSMMLDDDKDGKINEDGPDDMNGDGFISYFRYPDEKGRYLIDEKDNRLMTRASRNNKSDQKRYSMVREGRDNDKDGKVNEDGESGIDLNRNFPEVWFNENGLPGGSGDYPTCAPESHALAEFFTNYRNIFFAQFYHTSGGFTYRPLGTSSGDQMNSDDVKVFDFVLGKKYVELMGGDVPKAWLYPDSIASYRNELKKSSKNKYAVKRGYELPYLWKVSYDENRDRRYSYGMATDWLYKQLGIYSITTELWNPEADIPGFPIEEGRNRYTMREKHLLDYQDEHFDGKYFLPWKPYNHPVYGAGEIGGWIHQRNNAFPGPILEGIAQKHYEFERFRADLLPELKIQDVEIKQLGETRKLEEISTFAKEDIVQIKAGKKGKKYQILQIKAKVANLGKLATHAYNGSRLPGNRRDIAWLYADKGRIMYLQGRTWQDLGVLAGTMKVPGIQSKMKNSKELFWLIAVEKDTPLRLIVSSQKGGTTSKLIKH